LIEHRPNGGSTRAAAAEPEVMPKEMPGLKTVQPATLSEELDDGVPF
jgi:hypothetical protein